MAKAAPEYELVLMLDPEVPDEQREQITVDARQRIESGSTLKQERSWGLRKMSYEIDKRNEADYKFFRFEQSTAVLDDLNHSLKITDGVLRFRIFKVDAAAPVVDPPPPLNFAATSTDRPGGRGRRDDRGGGRSDDRPPRAPEPEATESAPEAAPSPEPAPETPAAAPEPALAPAPEAPPAEPVAAAPAEPAPADGPAAPSDQS